MEPIIPTEPKQIVLSDDERQYIATKYPQYVVDKYGYYITKAGKPRSARTLLSLRSVTAEDRVAGTKAIISRSEANQQNYLNLLEKGFQPTQAYKKLGLTSAWLPQVRRVPGFIEKEKAARIVATEKVVNAMFESALNGNFQAQNKILEQLDPDTWKADKTIKIEQTMTHELNAGDAVARIAALMAKIEERKELSEGYLDVEVISDRVVTAEEPTG